MVAIADRPKSKFTRRDLTEFAKTGSGTLVGRYMRMFWQPIYHSEHLPPGHARPVRVMSTDYTLYRGEGGAPHLVEARCLHRGMQLSAGWVEGDCIRCFYHGWKYDGSGQCVEQPAEPKSFAEKICLGGYPTQDYLGLIFAYMGEGEAPPFPRYPDFEDPQIYLELDSYPLACNYFNNLENSLDTSHVGFVHSRSAGAWDGVTDSPIIKVTESCWGITNSNVRPSGGGGLSQFGMPNMFHAKALPVEPEVIGYREFLVWWTPVDDESHIQYTVNALRLPADKISEYQQRRVARVAGRTTPQGEVAAQILEGKTRLQDIDPAITDMVRLQDDIAQIGQGVVPDRASDHLGQSDVGVILIRKLWTRELLALAEGRPLTQWKYDVEELTLHRDND